MKITTALAVAALAFTAMAPSAAHARRPQTQAELEVWHRGFVQGTLIATCTAYEMDALTRLGLRASAESIYSVSIKNDLRQTADEAFAWYEQRYAVKQSNCIKVIRPIFRKDFI